MTDLARKNRRIVIGVVGTVALMTALAFASVPLYRLFCQVTGFGGTPARVEAAPTGLGDRVVEVRFDSNVAPGLPWRFEPEQRSVRVRLGEQGLVYFKAANRSDKPIVGQATFNVTPLKAGQYFDKIQCFCFTEQKLEPGQVVDMPVTFFVDPKLAEDRNMRDVTTITLSYTFFHAKDDAANLAAAPSPRS